MAPYLFAAECLDAFVDDLHVNVQVVLRSVGLVTLLTGQHNLIAGHDLITMLGFVLEKCLTNLLVLLIKITSGQVDD